MKGQGIFRRIANGVKRILNRPIVHRYKDPVFVDPRSRKKKRGTGGGSGRWSKGHLRSITGRLPCIPGTGTYFDMLVRKFGRRQADKYQRCLIAGQPDLLPTPELLAATPDWAWRNG